MKPLMNHQRHSTRQSSATSFALGRASSAAAGGLSKSAATRECGVAGLLGGALLAVALPGCSSGDVTEMRDQDRTGSMSMAVTLVNARRDVVAFDFTIHPAGAGCGSEPVQSIRRVPLEEEGLPERFHDDSADDVGDNHPFADAFFVLDAGRYDVCARPVDEDGEASELCDVAVRESVRVSEGQTVEIRPALVSQCEVGGAGALDVIATLNTPPQITVLDLDPSKFINTCETLTLTPEAVDPEGDAVTFAWEVVDEPSGARVSLTPEGAPAEFSTDTPGDYEILLTASDSYDGVQGIESSTSLQFPVHVEEGGDCDAVGADLVPVGTAGLPGFFAFCERRDTQLLVTVANEGIATSPASTTRVRFNVSGAPVDVLVDTPSIGAGESVQVEAAIPAGCGDSCTFSIRADAEAGVPETNEINNEAGGACFG